MSRTSSAALGLLLSVLTGCGRPGTEAPPCVAAAPLGTASAATAEPLAQPAPSGLKVARLAPESPGAGRLGVSANGHYLQYADGTPFLWLGDTAWGMMQQLTREEIDHYLDHRKALGFTVIQTVAHWSPHGGGMDRSADNAANPYGHRPFVGSEKLPNTSQPLLVPGGSPESPNDYWDTVDYVVQAVAKRNMHLALFPTWAAQLVTLSGEYTEEEARSYGAFLGTRYGAFSNIIWVLGGDTKAQINGYNKHEKHLKFDNRAVFRAMAEGVASGATGQELQWNQPHPAWDQVLFSYHPNGDYPYGSAQWFHEDVWLDANGVEVWKEVDDVYRAMLDDFQRVSPVKPSLFLEGSYEYGTYRHVCGWVTPVHVRRQLYQTFFAGGAGHTYGAGPIWAMRGNGGDYNCGYTWKQALDFPGAAQVAQVAKAFLLQNEWHDWVPNGEVVSAAGQGDKLKAAVTSRSGKRALVYFSNNSHTTVNNVLRGPAKAFWFYPRNGTTQPVQSFAEDEKRVMAPPAKWEDAVLVLQRP